MAYNDLPALAALESFIEETNMQVLSLLTSD